MDSCKRCNIPNAPFSLVEALLAQKEIYSSDPRFAGLMSCHQIIIFCTTAYLAKSSAMHTQVIRNPSKKMKVPDTQEAAA